MPTAPTSFCIFPMHVSSILVSRGYYRIITRATTANKQQPWSTKSIRPKKPGIAGLFCDSDFYAAAHCTTAAPLSRKPCSGDERPWPHCCCSDCRREILRRLSLRFVVLQVLFQPSDGLFSALKDRNRATTRMG